MVALARSLDQGFAGNLRRGRLACEWSQSRLAAEANAILGRKYFDQVYISALERGMMPRSSAHVATLAKALGVSRRRLEQANQPLVYPHAAETHVAVSASV